MSQKKIKVGIVGTNGIPARYGGWETLSEHLTKCLSDDFDFTVYCSRLQPQLHKTFNGAKLIYVPLKANGWQSIFYDILTIFHSAIFSDVILYLGPGAGFVIPIVNLLNKKVIVNHGGLNEWERPKFSRLEKFFSKLGHKGACRFAAVNIADNFLLRDSLKKTFGVDSFVIRYGGDHAIKVKNDNDLVTKYPFLLAKFFVNVSRAQIDNNLHLVLEAFKNMPDKMLVMVSNWSISTYGVELKNEYCNKYTNIVILDAVYDSKEINAIRGNAFAYIHSHSYCGTSPSLVEAMSLGLPIVSFDVPTNRESTKNEAYFFSDSPSLINIVSSISEEQLKICGQKMNEIARKEYTWRYICSQYSNLFRM